MMAMAQFYMILYEKLYTRFGNPVSSNTNFSRLIGKEAHRQRDDSSWGAQWRYEKYTHLNNSRENIYQYCANT